jgi:hypothetical protein
MDNNVATITIAHSVKPEPWIIKLKEWAEEIQVINDIKKINHLLKPSPEMFKFITLLDRE